MKYSSIASIFFEKSNIMENTTVKERLTSYLAFKRINKSEFGRIIGVSTSFIASMRKSLQPDKVASIAQNFPDLNIQWLLTGEGNMLNAGSNSVGDGNIAAVVGNNNKQTIGNIDNRQYYSDSPDVLRAQIELLDERIKEKDAQIKEKDAQINRLLSILEKQ